MSEAEWIAFLQRPEFPAFNRAMLDNPEDDLPRLVFADWLDENCPDREVNNAVRESISGEHRQAMWPNLKGNRKWFMTLIRGRVAASINRQASPPKRRPPRILLEAVWQAGWVESLWFGTDIRGFHQHEWVGDPAMAFVSTLTLNGRAWGNPESITTLLRSSRPQNLLHLMIQFWPSPGILAHRLAEAPIVSRLNSLVLLGIHFTARDVSTLVSSEHIGGLRLFGLVGCEPSEEAVVALANSPRLANLTQLRLDHNTISPAGAAAIANSPYLCEAIRAKWRR